MSEDVETYAKAMEVVSRLTGLSVSEVCRVGHVHDWMPPFGFGDDDEDCWRRCFTCGDTENLEIT